MSRLEFLKLFFKNPMEIAAVTPSSGFLIRKMLKSIDFSRRLVVVELGGGTGVITAKLLEKITSDSVLFCFEKDSVLAERLKKVHDPRLHLINDEAENMGKYLSKIGPDGVDYVVSGLPVAVLPKDKKIKILGDINKYLSKGGFYIQFQYSLTSLFLLKKIFDRVSVGLELRNIPPAFVYVCSK